MTRSVLFAAALAIPLVAADRSARASDNAGCVPQGRVASIADASPLEIARRECPLLGSIIEEFALQDLGEAFPSFGARPAPHEILAMATVAASGDADAIRLHARNALDAGATTMHLRKMLYLTALRAGIPQAIEATRALSDLLAEHAGRPS